MLKMSFNGFIWMHSWKLPCAFSCTWYCKFWWELYLCRSTWQVLRNVDSEVYGDPPSDLTRRQVSHTYCVWCLCVWCLWYVGVIHFANNHLCIRFWRNTPSMQIPLLANMVIIDQMFGIWSRYTFDSFVRLIVGI